MTKKTKTRSPVQERSRDTRKQIILAGLKLFSDKGYYNTNSKEIAAEAGVSTGSFYAYFADKEGLFKEIFLEYHNAITDVLLSIDIDTYVASGDIRGFVRHITEKLIESHNISPGFHQELHVMALTNSDIAVMMKKIKGQEFSMTKNILNAWKGQLRIKDIEAAALIVQMAIEETVHQIKFSEIKRASDRRLIDELTDMLSRYLSE